MSLYEIPNNNRAYSEREIIDGNCCKPIPEKCLVIIRKYIAKEKYFVVDFMGETYRASCQDLVKEKPSIIWDGEDHILPD